jgi:hypothetical protein
MESEAISQMTAALPQRLKPSFFAVLNGSAKQAAEKIDLAPKSKPQGLKPSRVSSSLAAPVNSCPYQRPHELDFFRNPLSRAPSNLICEMATQFWSL